MNSNTSNSGVFALHGVARGDIVAFAPGVWGWPDFAGSPRYHLWGLASLGWRVLYVEPPKRLQLFSKMWKAPDREFHVLTPGRVPPFGVRLVPNEKTGDAWREKTAEGLFARAQEATRELKLSPSAYWFGAPWHGAIAKRLPNTVVKVAHVYDELSASPALEPFQRTLLWDWERELLRSMDSTMCSSEPQVERRSRIASRVILVQNAVAESQFPQSRLPPSHETSALAAKLSHWPEPRLVYGGTADHRLDERIFTSIATSFPNGSLIFAGHLDDSFPTGARKLLQSMPNVHFLGDVPYNGFPWLYSHANVLLLAHKRNDFTNSMYPEKLNEYLASGKPIVTVSLPEVGRITRESRERIAYFADTPEDFISAIQRACQEDDPVAVSGRQELARKHLWHVEAEKVDREMIRLVRMKGSPT